MILRYLTDILHPAIHFDNIYRKDESDVDECWDACIERLIYWNNNFLDFAVWDDDVPKSKREKFCQELSVKIEEIESIKDHEKRMEFIRTHYDEKTHNLNFLSNDIINFGQYYMMVLGIRANKILDSEHLDPISKVYHIASIFELEGVFDEILAGSLKYLWSAILELVEANKENINPRVPI